MSAGASRWAHVDALKVLACQLIVWHHLAFYGPMSDVVAPWAPELFEWLYRHGRVAVQVFLVVGGYLAARRLAPQGRLPASTPAWNLLGDRYARLVLPYAVMLLLAIAANALAREWMQHDSLSAPPRPAQLLAHVLLLHDVLGMEALSAGVWYVAIDFQLFALLLALLALSRALERRGRLRWRVAPVLAFVGVAASLLWFNLEAAWDVSAPYFFGSYGLGVLAAWWSGPQPRRFKLAALALLVGVALLLAWRERIAVAAAVAWLLALAQWRPGAVPAALGQRWVAALSRNSYGVFLVHFPVCLVVNAAFTAFMPAQPGWQALGLVTAWGASLAAGALFHHQVEQPLLAWVTARREGSSRSFFGLR